MAERFYNPGTKFEEKMAFDHPTNDIKHVNLISYFLINAPERDFFDVPSFVVVPTAQGETEVSVKFAERIQRDYRDYGLIRIDAKRKPEQIPEGENAAANEKDARVKGDLMWREYLIAKATEHITNVDMAHVAGVVPKRASGVSAHALKVLGMEDPADKVGSVVRSNQNVVGMGEMQAQIAAMQKTIDQLQKAK